MGVVNGADSSAQGRSSTIASMPGYYVYVVNNYTQPKVHEIRKVAAVKGHHDEIFKQFCAGEPQKVLVYNHVSKKTYGPFQALGPPVRSP